MEVAVASKPFAAPKTSLHGAVLTSKLQSWVHVAEQPESTVAYTSGKEEITSEVAWSDLGRAALLHTVLASTEALSLMRAELYG